MGALNIGCMLTWQRENLFGVTVDHLNAHPCQPATEAMFDHFEVLPTGLRLLPGGRTTVKGKFYFRLKGLLCP